MQLKRIAIVLLLPLLASTFFAVALASAAPEAPEAVNLVITEVMASNATAVEDPDEAGEYPDWIEVYNAGVLAVDLNGYFFSDDSADLTKHEITQTLVIAAGEYLLFYADSDPEQGLHHLDFRLGGGETVHIVGQDGATVIDSYTYAPATADVAEYRCSDDNSEWRLAANGTPGAANPVCTPVISGTMHLPVAPSPSTPVTVSATITDLASVTAATLWYDAGSGYVGLPMSSVGSHYEALIPAQPTGTIVNYYVEASNGSVGALDPHLAPTVTHVYQSDYVTPTIRINEIMASNASALADPDEAGEYPDWLELHNFGTAPIDLNGMILSISAEQYAITQSLTVAAGDYIIFYADSDSEQGLQHTNFRLPAAGETISLIDGTASVVVDSYTYANHVTDISEGRCASDATRWGFFQVGTPAAANGMCGPQITATAHAPQSPALVPVSVSSVISDNGSVASASLFYRVDGGAWMSVPMSAGATTYAGTIPVQASGAFVEYYVTATDNDSVQTYAPLNATTDLYSYYVDYTPPAVYLNEVMADNETLLEDPAEPGEYPDWFELYNPGPNAVDLKGFYLTDDVADVSSYYLITDTLIIAADGYLVFYADNDSEQGITHLPFRLSGNGETLTLIGKDGLTTVDGYTFGAMNNDDVFGRIPDGTGSWQTLNCATPGGSNTTCSGTVYLPIMLRP